MMLAQFILLPLLLLFTWGYLALRPASGHRTGLAIYDAAVIGSALLFSFTAVWLVNDMYAAEDNAIWLVVMSTVATFHAYPAVLLAGWYFRKKLFVAT